MLLWFDIGEEQSDEVSAVASQDNFDEMPRSKSLSTPVGQPDDKTQPVLTSFGRKSLP